MYWVEMLYPFHTREIQDIKFFTPPSCSAQKWQKNFLYHNEVFYTKANKRLFYPREFTGYTWKRFLFRVS